MGFQRNGYKNEQLSRNFQEKLREHVCQGQSVPRPEHVGLARYKSDTLFVLCIIYGLRQILRCFQTVLKCVFANYISNAEQHGVQVYAEMCLVT